MDPDGGRPPGPDLADESGDARGRAGGRSHRLVFTYEPESFRIGLLLTAAGAAGILAWGLAARRKRGAGAHGDG
jgi:hypothetical protein